MWRLVTLSSRHAADRRDSARRLRRHHRPNCTRLEERCLLSVAVTTTAPSERLVGSPVTWTASSRGHGVKPVYRFVVTQPDGSIQVLRDFGPSNRAAWNPLQEGTYQIRVDVKPRPNAVRREFTFATYTAQTRVVGDDAVVSAMANPLVALYSAPPARGGSMYVQFAEDGPSPSWQDTSPLPLVGGRSTNFLVAGMRPESTYLMRHVLEDGTLSAPVSFTTGGLPGNMTFPTIDVVQPPAAGVDPSQAVIFHAALPSGYSVNTLATNLNGEINWYYDAVANGFPSLAMNLEPGGTVMLLGGTAIGNAGGFDTLREVNLAGDTLRETNVRAMNAKLAAARMPQISQFDHEVKLLPNGNMVVLASAPRIVRYQGKPTKFEGNVVLVLDPTLRPVWAWNSFRWLDTNRIGTDQAIPGDWLHGNSVSYSPGDGNLVVSLRTQDWVVKLNYANGTGNGRVLWKLGEKGQFRAIANSPKPWFSHQHDARYVNDNTVVVFDNGNIRHNSNPEAHSRGQMWSLDERNMTATLVVNADLGNFSPFLGGAQLLPNGNLAFTSGAILSGGKPAGQTIQVLPDGTRVYVQQISQYEYRSYFASTLYNAGFLS